MSSSSTFNRFMESMRNNKALSFNMIAVGFWVVSLVMTYILAYIPGWNADNYGSFTIKLFTMIAAALAGVTGHLLQGPFQAFSVVLFLAVYNFFVAQFNHFSTASSATILAAQNQASLVLFWTLLFFGVVYLAFVFLPVIQNFVPTADVAYNKLRTKQSAPKQAAPAVAAAAPAPSA